MNKGRTILREKGSSGLQFAVVCWSGLPEQCIRRVRNLQKFHCISWSSSIFGADTVRRAHQRWGACQVQESSWTFVMAGSNQAGYLDPDCNVVNWTILSEARPWESTACCSSFHAVAYEDVPEISPPGLEDLSEKDIGLEVYSDAGFAPMQATQRRSTTGCVIVFRRVVLKRFSRHQASVTLSPCEAELVAIQAAVQEARCHNRFNEVMFTVAFCRQFPFQFHSETIWIFNFLAGRMPLNCALNTVGTFGRGNQVLLRWSFAFSQAPTLAHPMNGRGEGAILCIGTFPLRSMWQNSLRCCLQHVGWAACWNNRATNLWPCKLRIPQSFLENELLVAAQLNPAAAAAHVVDMRRDPPTWLQKRCHVWVQLQPWFGLHIQIQISMWVDFWRRFDVWDVFSIGVHNFRLRCFACLASTRLIWRSSSYQNYMCSVGIYVQIFVCCAVSSETFGVNLFKRK